jgi:flavin prenyltransferase
MQNIASNKPWIVGITGASGTVYARRLLQVLLDERPELEFELIISEAALRVMREEEGISVSPHSVTKLQLEKIIGAQTDRVRMHNNRNIGASIASGSYITSGMVIVPCSMASLAAIANGFGQTLIHRAADVTMKEGRKLVLVPRETPLSVIHLENMLKLAKIGVSLVPAMPGFYHQPKKIEDIIDMMVMRILDQMGIELKIAKRWAVGEEVSKSKTTWPIRSI